jgi:hypothetical protein
MDIQINKPYLNETREQIVIPVEVKKDMVVYNVSKPTTDNPIKEFKCTTARFLNLYKLTK